MSTIAARVSVCYTVVRGKLLFQNELVVWRCSAETDRLGVDILCAAGARTHGFILERFRVSADLDADGFRCVHGKIEDISAEMVVALNSGDSVGSLLAHPTFGGRGPPVRLSSATRVPL